MLTGWFAGVRSVEQNSYIYEYNVLNCFLLNDLLNCSTVYLIILSPVRSRDALLVINKQMCSSKANVNQFITSCRPVIFMGNAWRTSSVHGTQFSRLYKGFCCNNKMQCYNEYCLFQDRAFPSTLIEMKKLLSESTRFRNEEVPLRQREKQKLIHLYRELEVNHNMKWLST